MFGPCFALQYFVSLLVLKSSCCGRETWLLYFCLGTVIVMWLFLTVPWRGLQCVIVVFPGRTHTLCIYVISINIS